MSMMPNVVIGFFLFRIFGIHHGQNHLTEHVYYETNFPKTGDFANNVYNKNRSEQT